MQTEGQKNLLSSQAKLLSWAGSHYVTPVGRYSERSQKGCQRSILIQWSRALSYGSIKTARCLPCHPDGQLLGWSLIQEMKELAQVHETRFHRCYHGFHVGVKKYKSILSLTCKYATISTWKSTIHLGELCEYRNLHQRMIWKARFTFVSSEHNGLTEARSGIRIFCSVHRHQKNHQMQTLMDPLVSA